MSLKNILLDSKKEFAMIFFIYLGFVVCLSYIYNFDLSLFVQFSKFTNLSDLPLNITKTNGIGYDGQYYFRFAYKPFNFDTNFIGIAVENTSYRYSRLAYPMLIWMLTLGKIEYIIPFSIIFNFLSIICIFLINYKIFNILKVNKNNLLYFMLLPGFLFCISRNLPEILEILLISSSILLYLKNKKFFYIMITCVLVLTRETSIIFLISILIIDFLKNKKIINILYLVFPIFFYLFWTILLFLLFNDTPLNSGIKLHFEKIFLGIYKMILSIFSSNENFLKRFSFLIQYIYIYSSITLGFFLLYKFKIADIIKIPFVLYSIYFLCLSPVVLSSDWAFMRVFLELNYFTVLVIFYKDTIYSKYYKLFSSVIFFFVVSRILIDQYLKYSDGNFL